MSAKPLRGGPANWLNMTGDISPVQVERAYDGQWAVLLLCRPMDVISANGSAIANAWAPNLVTVITIRATGGHQKCNTWWQPKTMSWSKCLPSTYFHFPHLIFLMILLFASRFLQTKSIDRMFLSAFTWVMHDQAYSSDLPPGNLVGIHDKKFCIHCEGISCMLKWLWIRL